MLILLNQHHRVCAYSLLPSGEAKTLCCGGLYGDVVLADAHHLSQTTLHCRHVRVYFRSLGAYRRVDIAYAVALLADERHHLAQ